MGFIIVMMDKLIRMENLGLAPPPTPTPSYGIVDMGDSDLIHLLDKIGMSIDAEWGRICSTYVNLS